MCSMSLFRTVPAIVAICSLVACGGGGGDSQRTPASSASGTAVEQPAPPGFDSVREARAEYLRLLEPAGIASEDLSTMLDAPNPDVPDLRQAAFAFAAATDALGKGLNARTWPSEVAAPIAELAKQLLAQVTPLRDAAMGQTAQDISQGLGAVPSAATAAENVRDAFKRAGG